MLVEGQLSSFKFSFHNQRQRDVLCWSLLVLWRLCVLLKVPIWISAELLRAVTPRNNVATRQNASHFKLWPLSSQTNGAYSTRYTHMNTNNSKSVDMSHIDKASLLRGLNPAQRKGGFRSPAKCVGLLLWFIAVEHEPDIPLQILAGPGSGKTKVSSGKRAYTVSSYPDIVTQTFKGPYI